MNKILFLVRGLPGSGKTTVAKELARQSHVYSADDYFMVNGEYYYNPDIISEAHAECFKNVKNSMRHGNLKIFVANTFVKEWELQLYYDLAREYNYTVVSMIVEHRHNGKNVHDVPNDIIRKMAMNFSIRLTNLKISNIYILKHKIKTFFRKIWK